MIFNRLNTKEIFIISVFSIITILPSFVSNNYLPSGIDESYQIQSALRLLNGEGWTIISKFQHKNPDISNPDYVYADYWPPLYAVILATFLYSGIDLTISLILFQLLVSFLVFSGWLIFAKKYFDKPLTILSLLSLILYITLNFTSKTEGIVLAIFPFVLLNIAKGIEEQEKRFFISAGLLTGICMLSKYSAYYIPLGVSLFLLLTITKRDFLIKVKAILFYTSIPIIVGISLFLLPKIFSNESIVSELFPSSISSLLGNFEFIWIVKYIKSTFLGIFRFDDIIIFISKNFIYIDGILICYIIGVVIMCIFVFVILNLWGHKKTLFGLILPYLSMFIAAFVFLLIASFIVATESWTPLETPRYTMAVTPLMIIIFLFYFEKVIRSQIIIKSAYIVILLIIFVFAIFKTNHETIEIKKYYSFKSSLIEKIEEVQTQYPEVNNVVIFSSNNVRKGFLMSGRYHAIKDLTPLNNGFRYTKPTIVFIIEDLRDIKSISNYRKEEYKNLKNNYKTEIQTVSRSLMMDHIQLKTAILYYKVFG